MESCIFCNINAHILPAETIYEDQAVHVFADIHPKAPIHFLIVPKKHIESVATLTESDTEIVSLLVCTAKKIAEEKHISGYKLLFNVGRKGGQLVDHIHLHLIGGWEEGQAHE